MKRSIKSIIAISLIGCLTLGTAIFAYAEPYTESDEIGPQTEKVEATGEGTVVEVNGDVNVSKSDDPGQYCGVQAIDGAEVIVDGNVTGPDEGVVANGGTITVTGDVTAPNIGVLVEPYEEGERGYVEVDGSVNGGVVVNDGVVVVGENVTGAEGSAALRESGDSSIFVNGDVTSSGAGIMTDGNSLIVIDGTLTADESEPAVIVNHFEDTSASQIIVYEIKGNTDNLVKTGYTEWSLDDEGNSVEELIEDADPTLKNSQQENIFYIIRKAEGSESNISALTGTKKREGYDTAPANTVITVSVKEGYGVTAGTIKVTKNADGTYTLTVPAGGGVTLTAEQLQKAVDEIEKKEEQQQNQNQNQQQQQNQQAQAKAKESSSGSGDDEPAVVNNGSGALTPYVAITGVTLVGENLGNDAGIRMDEAGPAAAAAFENAMPEGYSKAYVFSVTNGGQTTYTLKDGKLTFKIPAQYLKDGRKFKLMGIDKDGKVKVFDNKGEGDNFEADVDIEGYQFELVYAD